MRRTDSLAPLLLSFALMLVLGGCKGAPDQAAAESERQSAPATATPPGGGPVVETAGAPDQLIGLEKAYSKALIAKDRAFLEGYYAPDFRGGNWMGFWTKSTMLKAVLDDRYSVRSMDLSNLQVRIVGSTGIVQGVSTEVTRVNGKDTSGRWSFTDVFEFRNGRWLAVASHTSELKADGAD